MAAAKWRRPDRKVPGCQSPRMYFCWMMLISLAMVLGETNRVQLRYDRGEKKLRIECPQAEGDILEASYLYRVKNSVDDVKLAQYVYGKNVTNHYERIEATVSPGPRLVATLSHVTCFDSATYKCRNMIGSRGQYSYWNFIAPFQYTGEVTKPYLSALIRTRYLSGEELQLNCSATVGWEENGIVWSITRATAKSPLPLQAGITHEHSVDPDCSLRRSSQLLHTLTPEDDGAIFECRLNASGHHAEIIIALRCPDVPVNGPNESDVGVSSEATDPHRYPDTPRAEEVKGLEGSHNTAAESQGSSSSSSSSSSSRHQETDNLTLMIVVCTLAVIVALMAGGMFLLIRRWRKGQIPALVVVDTPSSSEYGYNTTSAASSSSSSSSSERQLPHLPNLSSMLDRHHPHSHHPHHPTHSHHRHHHQHQHHSFPDAFPNPSLNSVTGCTSATSRYVDSPLSSWAHSKDDPNLSVYVTMTNLDYLHHSLESSAPSPAPASSAAGGAGGKTGPGLGAGPPEPPPASSPEGRLLPRPSPPTASLESDDYDHTGPDMGEERSESIYSNDGWNHPGRGMRGDGGGGGGSGGGGGGRNNSNGNGSNHVMRGDVAADEVTRLKIVD